MKRTILLLVIVFITSLLVHLPLPLIAKYIPKNPQLVLASPKGTIWRGSFYSVRWNKKNLGRLSWNVNVKRLFLGQFDIHFTLTGQTGVSSSGNAGVSFSGPYARNIQLDVESTFIDSLIVSPLPIQTKGKLAFTIDKYVYSSPWCGNLNGQGRWQNAALNFSSQNLELGRVSATFSCQSGNIFVKTASSSGALDSNINLTLLPKNRYKIEGNLLAKDNFPTALRSQLQWLGKPDSQGRYPLTFSG